MLLPFAFPTSPLNLFPSAEQTLMCNRSFSGKVELGWVFVFGSPLQQLFQTSVIEANPTAVCAHQVLTLLGEVLVLVPLLVPNGGGDPHLERWRASKPQAGPGHAVL